MRRAQATRDAATAAADETLIALDGGTAAPAAVRAFLNATTAQAAMAAAARSPTALADAVGEGDDNPNMGGLITQPDLIEDSSDDNNEDDGDDERDDDDEGEDEDK